MEKLCQKCNITKPIERFYFVKERNSYISPCKDCTNSLNKERKRAKAAAKVKPVEPEGKLCHKCDIRKPKEQFHFDKRTNNYHSPCIECNKKHGKEKRQLPENKEKRRLKGAEYRNRPEVKEKIKQQAKEYRSRPEHKAHINKYLAKYREKNKERITTRRRAAYKIKIKVDFNLRIRKALRSRVSKAVKKSSKFGTTMELVGCDIIFLRKWLESQFDEHTNWLNYGSYWAIDHITPCSSFNLTIEDQQKICFNWKNLRPLENRENMSKCDKIDEELILRMKILADTFEKTNLLN